MVEIIHRASLELWLKGKPPDAALAIATRVALRLLPLTAEDIDKAPSEYRSDVILTSFRLTLTALVACRSRRVTDGTRWSFTFPAPNRLEDISKRAKASFQAAIGAGIAATELPEKTFDSAASAIEKASRSLVATAGSGPGDGMPADCRQAMLRDIELLSAGGRQIGTPPHTALLDERLWHELVPLWAVEGWHELRTHLLEADEGWEVWTNWYDSILLGQALDPDLEAKKALIADEVWQQGPEVVNAEVARLIFEHTPVPKQTERGARWEVRADRLAIVAGSAEIGGRAPALQPLAIEALQELVDAIGPSNQFAKLSSKAERALEIVRKPLQEVNEHSTALWSLSVWLGDFADGDDVARRDPRSFVDALGEHQRVALNAAIRQTAAFTRQFRTALELDIEDASFRRSEFRIEPHREIAAEARAQDLIGAADHETLENLAEAAAGPAVQSAKASAGLTFSVRNLLVLGAILLAPAAITGKVVLETVGKEIGQGIAEGAAVRDKARRMAENAADAIDEVIRASPPDLRHGLAPLQSPRPSAKP